MIVTFDKLTRIASYLKSLVQKIVEKGEERLNNTKLTIQSLKNKLNKFMQSKEFVLDYSKPITDLFNFFSAKMSYGGYPGKVRI